MKGLINKLTIVVMGTLLVPMTVLAVSPIILSVEKNYDVTIDVELPNSEKQLMNEHDAETLDMAGCWAFIGGRWVFFCVHEELPEETA